MRLNYLLTRHRVGDGVSPEEEKISLFDSEPKVNLDGAAGLVNDYASNTSEQTPEFLIYYIFDYRHIPCIHTWGGLKLSCGLMICGVLMRGVPSACPLLGVEVSILKPCNAWEGDARTSRN